MGRLSGLASVLEETTSDDDVWGRFLSDMDQAGVGVGVFAMGAEAPGWENATDEIARAVSLAEGRLIGAVALDPFGRLHDPVREIERATRVHGCRVVSMSLSSGERSARLNDPLLDPVYRKCVELDVPLVTSVLRLDADDAFAHPDDAEDALLRHPGLSLVLAHGPYPYVDQYVGLARRCPGLHVMPDYLSSLESVGAYFEAANGELCNQVLFGSAYPIQEMRDAVRLYDRLPLTPAARERVMSSNWRRLLKLP